MPPYSLVKVYCHFGSSSRLHHQIYPDDGACCYDFIRQHGVTTPPPTKNLIFKVISVRTLDLVTYKIYTTCTSLGYAVPQLRLRHRATRRKVAGSIQDGVIGIFHWHNPSGRTMALGVDSASNRNEYQEYFLMDKGGRCVGLTTLPPSCADCLEIWEPQPAGTLRVCPGL